MSIKASQFGYSQCVRAGNLVFLAGQCGLGDDHEIVSNDFVEQAKRALERIETALHAAGGTLSDIVSMTVYITDTRQGRLFTSLRRELFRDHFPASALIEIQAIAVLAST